MNNKDNTTKNRQYSGRYLSSDRRKTRKRRARQRSIVIVSAIVLALLILVIVLISKSCSNSKKNTKLLGVWQYDQYTEYEFKDSNNGCMCLDNNTHYEFTYSIKENVLYIDFTLDYVTDCQYTYTLEGDKLTLVGGEGTAEVGKAYELTKIK
ncbi:MAG: hypothetical protein IKJ80_00080 [Clostridia bacterium]|nr:hypothetical protein [Clostridia bacterium]